MTFHFPRSTLAGLGCALWLTLALPAQQPGPSDPAPAPREAAPTDTESEAGTAAIDPEENEDGLRRLDLPAAAGPGAPSAGEAPAATEDAEAPPPPERPSRHQRQMVQFFTDVTLAADERAEELVAIFGNVVADGVAHGSAVAVVGDVTVNGFADEAVAVMGSVHVSGRINEAAVAVMGDATVNGEAEAAVAVLGSVSVAGHIHGDLVAVLGNVRLGPNAIVEGEIVSIGGRVERAPGAEVYGGIQQIGPFPVVVDGVEGLRTWFRLCLAFGRPLAFDSRVAWAWGVAAAFLAFYLVISLLFNRSVISCAQTLERRPGMTILVALVTALLAPILTILLSFIGVGLLLIPLLMLAGLYGKATFLAWLGRRITLPLGWGHSFPAVLFGGIILMLLYVVPFLGFLIMKGTSLLGLGMVVYTILLAGRKESRPRVAPLAGGAVGAPLPTATEPLVAGLTAAGSPASRSSEGATGTQVVGAPADPVFESGATARSGPAATAPQAAPAAAGAPVLSSGMPVPPPVPIDFSAHIRAGFWLRLGASMLDLILVGIVLGMVGLRGYLPLVFAAYCVVLWSLRATTIGGIICGLKVVRLDERKIDWSIAIVRALGGFLSLAVVGLGFVWVAFDKDRQSWHDKIAGTTVVRVPKGVALV